MVTAKPFQVQPGQLFANSLAYFDDEAEKWMKKYILVLGVRTDGDIVFRMLTSQQYARPEKPPCYHGFPYPGFYLGILGGPLKRQSWLVLGPGEQEDYDRVDFAIELASGTIQYLFDIPRSLLCGALACAAGINATNTQVKIMRDFMARIGCS